MQKKGIKGKDAFMKAYSHLVFDIDGTLIDTVKIHMISLERTLKKYWGADAKLPDLRFSFGIPGTATMETLGFTENGRRSTWPVQRKRRGSCFRG